MIIRNPGGQATVGTVTVSGTLPAGLSATGLSGTGWTCDIGTLTCTRSDSIASGASFPPVTMIVNVASNAGVKVTNVATVSGGGETNIANDVASDPTVVWSSQTCGGFGAPAFVSGNLQVRDLVAGDFNHDGKMDIAIANDYYGGTVSVHLGNGSGGFAAPVYYTLLAYGTAIATGDFNNDGNLDLAVAAYYNNDTVSIMLGNGDGTFNAPVSVTIPGGYYATTGLAIADYNADGRLDVVAVNHNTTNNVSVLLGNGNGTL